MRFFSNDARETTDEQDRDNQDRTELIHDGQDRTEVIRDGQTDRVQSDPVAVPSQRPPSPWSNTPAAAGDGPGRRDDADGVVDPDGVAGREDTDPPPFHEPSPQPTAFGGSTVGGAVAASATANPENDRWDATDRQSAADSGVGDDSSVVPGDGVVTSSTNTYASSTATTDADSRDDRTDPDDLVDLPLDDQRDGRPAGAVSAQSDDAPVTAGAPALKDEGGFDDPKAVDPTTEQPLADSTVDDDDRTGDRFDPSPDVVAGGAAVKDEGGFDDPKAVDPVTDNPLDDTDVPAGDTASTPVVAVPVADSPAAATSTATDKPAGDQAERLFDAGDAREFQDRWRDVQLRFVDSPKDAAGDAAKLVDEAVEKLTASLRSQRDGLGGDSEDTEQLRVQLRGYRDILNRILSL